MKVTTTKPTTVNYIIELTAGEANLLRQADSYFSPGASISDTTDMNKIERFLSSLDGALSEAGHSYVAVADQMTLIELAQACVLEQANSSTPGDVLARYFHQAFDLGKQEGMRQTTEALDTLAEEEDTA